jgi:hypothetical protein
MRQRPPKRYAGERPLDAAETERRGRAVRLASTAHPTPQAAVAFLNDHHPALGGRPLDIATGSAAGLAAVEAALRNG